MTAQEVQGQLLSVGYGAKIVLGRVLVWPLLTGRDTGYHCWGQWVSLAWEDVLSCIYLTPYKHRGKLSLSLLAIPHERRR